MENYHRDQVIYNAFPNTSHLTPVPIPKGNKPKVGVIRECNGRCHKKYKTEDMAKAVHLRCTKYYCVSCAKLYSGRLKMVMPYGND